MTTTRTHRPLSIALLAVVLTVLTVVAVGTRAEPASSTERHHSLGTKSLTVDIAENGHRFFFDEAPVFPEDGMPAAGNSFVTQGYIYPAGTLSSGDGVNADGSPQWPDKVIGEWLCRGYYIADGAHTKKGSWVFTTQLLSLGKQPDQGRQTVVITGYEGAEVGARVTGAVTGGTGRYSTARGEAQQTLLGFNNGDAPTMGINKRIVVDLAR